MRNMSLGMYFWFSVHEDKILSAKFSGTCLCVSVNVVFTGGHCGSCSHCNKTPFYPRLYSSTILMSDYDDLMFCYLGLLTG